MHHHDHHHHHAHGISPDVVSRAFLWGIALNLAFVVIEVAVGFYTGSLALLSDAGHNLGDVASLALSLLGFRLAKVKPTFQYTYGYRKASVLIALINSLMLMGAVLGIGYEAIIRLQSPQAVPGNAVAVVAFIGILVNSLSAWLFLQNKDNDLNIKSAYLHLAADALVSLGVVVGGVLLHFTHWLWLDSLLGIVIAVIIALSSWSLLTESLRLALDGVPGNVDLKKAREKILTMPHVADFTHIHVWAISTTRNALTAELEVENLTDLREIELLKDRIRHELQHANIHHSTIEVILEKETMTACTVDSAVSFLSTLRLPTSSSILYRELPTTTCMKLAVQNIPPR